GKQRARIDLAPRRQVRVADHRGLRDAVARGQVLEQAHHRGHLRLAEGLDAVVVDLDADRGRVEFVDRAPAAGTRVPGAMRVGDELVDAPIVADQVVRAYPAPAVGG